MWNVLLKNTELRKRSNTYRKPWKKDIEKNILEKVETFEYDRTM